MIRKTSEIGPKSPKAELRKGVRDEEQFQRHYMNKKRLPSSQAIAGTGNWYRTVTYHTIKLSTNDFEVGT
jgi:hypothetical protein